VLSNKELRSQYDKFGKEKAMPSAGFEDPAEFFSMIFGGDAFVDLIGEISLMKDLTHTMDITMEQMEEEELAKNADEKLHIHDEKEKEARAHSTTPSTAPPPPPYASGAAPEAPSSATAGAPSAAAPHLPPRPAGTATPETPASGTSTPRRYLGQQAIMDRSEEDARMDAAGLTAEEKELRKKEKKKGGLTKEQRDRLDAYEKERRKIRDERVETLAKKLVDRISVWTETDKGPEVTKAFEEKIRLEVENLKMESFGLEILHAIGTTYLQKATSFLKSQKFLGISGFFSRLKDKGTLAKETWNTISTAIDAQLTMEEMAKMEEKGGEDWTDEKKAEYEKRVTGKILAAAWKGSKFEIQGVLRDVCDKILNDKTVRMEKRIERAHALVLSGTIYQKVGHTFTGKITMTDGHTRLSVTPRKKETTWPLNSSWQKLPRSKKRRKIRRRPARRKRKRSLPTITTRTTHLLHLRNQRECPKPRPRRERIWRVKILMRKGSRP
jgi:X-domain of DnaJ-containing